MGSFVPNNSSCSRLSKPTSLETLLTNVLLPWRDHLVSPFVAFLEHEHVFCLTSWSSRICTHGSIEEDKLPYILPDIHRPCHCQEAQDSSLTPFSWWLLALEVEDCRPPEAYKQVQKDQGLKKTSWLSVSCFWTWMMCGTRPDPACSSHSLAGSCWLQPNIRDSVALAALQKIYCTPWGQAHRCLCFEPISCLGTGDNKFTSFVLRTSWLCRGEAGADVSLLFTLDTSPTSELVRTLLITSFATTLSNLLRPASGDR